MREERTRLAELDLIRAAAIIFVVLNHSVEICASLHDVDAVNGMSDLERLISLSGFTLGRLGVPLFFFLTGYLLLPREFDPPSTTKFYRRNFLSLLATWELWIVIYNLILAASVEVEVQPAAAFFFERREFQTETLLRNMLFVEGVGIGHSWYVGVILGIYIFIPIVSRALRTIDDRELLTLLLLSFAYFFVLPTVDRFVEIKLMPWLDLTFSGGLYGFYVLIGCALRRFEQSLRSIGSFVLLVSTVGLILLTALIQADFYARGEAFLIWYDFALLPPAAIGLFILLKRANVFNRAIELASRCSFGIYLLHAPLIILLLREKFFLSTPIWTATLIILSTAIIIVLEKIPFCGKILFRAVRKY